MHKAEIGEFLIGQSDLSEQLMRALVLKGDLPQELQRGFGCEITALDLTAPEFRWLRRTTQYTAFTSVAAGGAGFYSYCELTPAASKLTVLERVRIGNPNGAAQLCFVGFTGGNFIGVTVTAYGDRDNRQPLGGRGSAQVTHGVSNATASPWQHLGVYVPPLETVTLEGPWILSQTKALSSAFTVMCNPANTGLDCTFEWTERQIQDTEK
jgi:hypothetical protein